MSDPNSTDIAAKLRHEIKAEYDKHLEEMSNENSNLRKIIDDMQRIDALNVQNQRDTQSVGSMDHYLDWLKNLLRGRGHEGDVCDLVNIFLHEVDRDELALAGHEGSVEDYESVRNLFENHPEFEMSFQSFLEAKMEEEVQKEEEKAFKSHKVLQKRMSIVSLSKQTIEQFSMIHTLLQCRLLHYETSSFLHNRSFEQKILHSFGEPPQQQSANLDEIIEDATRAKTKLNMLLAEWLRDKLLDPDQLVSDGFKVLTKVPLKSRKRCQEKAKQKYGGDFKRIVDVARCSIVVGSENLLSDLVEALLMNGMKGITAVRLKNRIKHPLFTGARDCLVNVSVDIGNGKTHIAEIQLQLAPFLKLRKQSLEVFNFFRDHFKTSPTDPEYQNKADILDRLHSDGEAAPSGAGFAQELLACDSVGRLVALDELTSPLFLDKKDTNLKCRARLLTLAEERGACEEMKLKYMDALSSAYSRCSMNEELLENAKRTYQRKKALFGEDHPETKKSLDWVASGKTKKYFKSA